MVLDFHTHTYNSADSMMRPAEILRIAKERGLTGIVINDHDTIKGGLECKALNKDERFEVIIGAEIATDIGDVTGIFLKEEIQQRKFSEVVEAIRKQGGITILNHPYVKHRLSEVNFDGIDLIEGFNSRVDWEKNLKAVELAKTHGKPVVAGSDAHTYSEIANCKTYYDGTNILEPAQLEFRRNIFLSNVYSQLIKSYKRKDIMLGAKTLLGTPRKAIGRILESRKTFRGTISEAV